MPSLPDALVRWIFGAIALTTAGLMATALYFEHVMMLEPCPLCMTQRIWVVLMGLTCLAAFVHGPSRAGLRRYALVAVGCAVIGSGFSLRQLYLQSLPPGEAPACGPGLSYMWENFPLADVVRAMTFGSGDCATVSWSLLGLSIPGWVLVAFVGLSVAAALAFLPRSGAPAEP